MVRSDKEKLFGKTLDELKALVSDLGLPAFNAKILAEWLYKKGVASFDEMTNLSKKARLQLNEKYTVGLTPFSAVEISADGTKKYLFPVGLKKYIEAAYIPEKERATLCVSSQAGCKMGCLFCMTGKQGFQGNLTAGEIVNQIHSLPEKDAITNVVYMGMGEPFDNISNVLKSLEILTADYGYAWSPKRITVSSIGIVPALKRFLDESKCHLAISLHTPFHEERKELMPVENVYSLQSIIDIIKQYDFTGQRRVSFEYIMFKDVNDTPRHVKELVKLLDGLKCRINLIRFHPIPGTPLLGSDEQAINEFKELLNNKGITTTIRASRGIDISAACGLLSTKQLVGNQETDY
ncbi:MAG: 23S rRNA (adenine(2503)-C(2))-methyltransferase RlmN [Bacteroidota bacterium]